MASDAVPIQQQMLGDVCVCVVYAMQWGTSKASAMQQACPISACKRPLSPHCDTLERSYYSWAAALMLSRSGSTHACSLFSFSLSVLLCLLLCCRTHPSLCCYCRILYSLLFSLIAAGMLSIFFHSKVMNIIISGIGAAVFSCYIVFDVQLMMGGGTYAIDPDEYVFAGERGGRGGGEWGAGFVCWCEVAACGCACTYGLFVCLHTSRQATCRQSWQ